MFYKFLISTQTHINMYSKYTFIIMVLAAVLLTNCANTSPQKITDISDYNAYLTNTENETLNRAKQNEVFWSDKLEKAPNQFGYHSKLASTYTAYFTSTGDVKYLKKAESELLVVNERTKYNNPSYLKSLAYNYISQHRFKEALEFLEKAEILK